MQIINWLPFGLTLVQVIFNINLFVFYSEIIPAKPSSNKVTQASLTKLGERIVKKFNLDPGTTFMEQIYKMIIYYLR
jgi:hypothetical protein